MIHLVYTKRFAYWVIDENNGALRSATTAANALQNYLHEVFILANNRNNYTIKNDNVYSHSTLHGHIVASAKTIKLLKQNYPEFFV